VAKSDEELVSGTLNGTMSCFDELMIRYQKLCYKIAFSYVRDRHHALDIVQNSFMRAYRKLPTLMDGALFKAWIVRITYNESVSWQRRAVPEAELSLEQLESQPGQEAHVIHEERRRHLAQILEVLNPKHRLAIVLKYIEGLPVKEVARILQCSEGVVKNILYRSMKKLAAQAEKGV